MGNTQNNCTQKFGAQNFLGNSHSQDRKRTRKDNSGLMFDWLRGREMEGTGGIRIFTVLDSGGHFSLSELHFTHIHDTKKQCRKILQIQEII